MPTIFKIYMLCWSAACVVAIVLLIKDRANIALWRVEYRQFLFQPWRLITFAIACLGMVVIAPYTGDPTWDYFDALFMSILTYLSAPWVMGALFNAAKREVKLPEVYAAVCAWLFSASWSYDLYLVMRDGTYPITWLPNLFASSVLYVSAGLFWSLDWIQGRGGTFAFLESGWPYRPSESSFSKVFLYALPFMAFVSFLIVYFFWFQ